MCNLEIFFSVGKKQDHIYHDVHFCLHKSLLNLKHYLQKWCLHGLLISELLPLCTVLTVSIVEALDVACVACFWSSTSLELLIWFFLLQKPGNNLKTEPIILEKALGLLAALTRNFVFTRISDIQLFHIGSHKIINFAITEKQ